MQINLIDADIIISYPTLLVDGKRNYEYSVGSSGQTYPIITDPLEMKVDYQLHS